MKFHKKGIIELKKLSISTGQDQNEKVYTLSEDYKDEERLQAIFDQLTFYKKRSITKISNLKTDIRKSMLSDYPFMAKL
jgi:uncharacterized protein YjaG (DUF416 family)